MGPYFDLAFWTTIHQTYGPSAGTLRLAALFTSGPELTIQHFGWGFGFSLAGAVMGGVSVRLAHRKHLSTRKKEQESRELEHQQFLAAAETSADAFYTLDSVRDPDGGIVDFTFRYLNTHAAKRLDGLNKGLIGTSYRQSMGHVLNEQQFNRYCEVASSGTPLTVEFPVSVPGCKLTWLRHQVVKLDDGIAITSTDLSDLKAAQDRFQSVTEFSDTIFAHAPFSIISTDAAGM